MTTSELIEQIEHNGKTITQLQNRLEMAMRKLSKLKALMLLVDPAVSKIVIGEVQHKQWAEFIKEFPDESG